MKKNKDISEINNKADTAQLIDYLEGSIADEMILSSFIRGIEVIKVSKNNITIKCPSVESKNMITEHYLPSIKQGVYEVYGSPLDVRLVLEHEIDLLGPTQTISLKESKNIAKKFRFDNYTVSEFNKEIVSMIQRIIKTPGYFSPLYIYSNSGLGKTHLLHAIANKMIEQGLSCIYIEPNSFTEKVQYHSKNGTLSVFKDELKDFDVLLLDDVQNFENRSVTLGILFNIIDDNIMKDKQIIISSDREPQQLSGFESRFKTRFTAGRVSSIKRLKIDDVKKVLIQKLKEEDMHPENWDKESLMFIARNNTTSIRGLEGSVKRVKFFTEGEKIKNYSFNKILSIFKGLSIDVSELTPSRVISIVAKYYKISESDITGKSRRKDLALIRHISIYLVREVTNLNYVAIGKFFGNRDHSTIISAYNKIKKQIEIDRAIKLAINAIKVKINKIS